MHKVSARHLSSVIAADTLRVVSCGQLRVVSCLLSMCLVSVCRGQLSGKTAVALAVTETSASSTLVMSNTTSAADSNTSLPTSSQQQSTVSSTQTSRATDVTTSTETTVSTSLSSTTIVQSTTSQNSTALNNIDNLFGEKLSNVASSPTSATTTNNYTTTNSSTTNSVLTTSATSSSMYQCYSCNGPDCNRPDANTATCPSATRICFIRYDVVKSSRTLDCRSALPASIGCGPVILPQNMTATPYATTATSVNNNSVTSLPYNQTAADYRTSTTMTSYTTTTTTAATPYKTFSTKGVCEYCCTTPLCNRLPLESALRTRCRQDLDLVLVSAGNHLIFPSWYHGVFTLAAGSIVYLQTAAAVAVM